MIRSEKTKRQRIRGLVILFSFLFFPLSLYYLSPVLALGLGTMGIISGSVVVFIALLLISVFLGRSFCGWACPAAGLQESLFRINDQPLKKDWPRFIKYIVWILWLGFLVFIFIRAGKISKIDIAYESTEGVLNEMTVTVYLAVSTIIFLFAVFGKKRLFCHTLCWISPFMVVGTSISRLLHIPRLHLKSDKDQCISCGVCSKNCPMSLPVQEMVQNEKMFQVDCILCGECIDGCSKNAIRYGFFKEF